METAAATKLVYDFAEGSRDMRDLLGGKGANVAEMTRVLGAERVPAGFTITTDACVAYMKAGNEFPDGLEEQVAEALGRLEEQAEKRLGDASDPLLVSVRSGARESMPGMLDTVLNLGLNDESVEGLADRPATTASPGTPIAASCRCSATCAGASTGERFEELIEEHKGRARRLGGHRAVGGRPEGAHRRLQGAVRGARRARSSRRSRQEQLEQAIGAVFDSWTGERAVEYRRINRIPDEWGTAVNVQQMVFGNRGDDSGSGVAFSRDEITGAPEPSGDFLPNAQGEDVVSGVRTPRDISEMADLMPDAHAELMEILRTLERHYGDMQDTEFTVEEGRLYMLQTRNAKRPAQAAVQVRGRRGGRGTARAGRGDRHHRRRAPRRAAAPRVRRKDAEFEKLTEGIPASPGAAKGAIVFTADDAVAAAADGRDVILVRPHTDAGDVVGFHAAQGILTSRGGKASHAALVARGMGKPCVAGRRGAEDRPGRQDGQRERDRSWARATPSPSTGRAEWSRPTRSSSRIRR